MNPWYILSIAIQSPLIISHSLLQISYAPGSPERAALQAAIAQMEQDLPFEVPVIINGEPVSPELRMCLCHDIELSFDVGIGRIVQVKTGKLAKQSIPSDHARNICTYHEADESTVARAIEGALAARAGWEAMPWGDRAAIFLKAADLISKKYRYKLIAATVLGQGKNVWQAEIDAAAEVSMVGTERRSTTGQIVPLLFSLRTFSALG